MRASFLSSLRNAIGTSARVSTRTVSCQQARFASCIGLLKAQSNSAFLEPASISRAMTPVRSMAHPPPDLQEIADRVMYILKLFDKIDVNKLHEKAHFMKDLGLNSLDHVEIIIHIEDDFSTEIPEHIMDRLVTPDDIIQFLGDRHKAKDFDYIPQTKEELLGEDPAKKH